VLIVSDTGPGISAEFLPRVFERFTQHDSSSTRTHQGLGLGLAICRHLVELHGGSIHAESGGKGQAATFTVKLPLALVRSGPTAEAAETRAHPLAHEETDVISGAASAGIGRHPYCRSG